MRSSTSGASCDEFGEKHGSENEEKMMNTEDGASCACTEVHKTLPSCHLENPSPTSINPLTTSHSLEMLTAAAAATLSSSPRDDNRDPYNDTSHTSKRFNPEKYEEEQPDNTDMLRAPPRTSNTWMPPDLADDLGMEQGSRFPQDTVSNSTDDYTGPVLFPGQLSSLTMYGYPRGVISSAKKRSVSMERNAIENRSPRLENSSPSHRRSRPHHLDKRTTTHETQREIAPRISPETSSAKVWTNLGIPARNSDRAYSTFEMRAKQAGIPDWREKVEKGLVGNNSVFDGRWILNPDEAWNVPARRNSALTISPRSQRSVRSARSAMTEDSGSPTKYTGGEHSSQETLLPVIDQGSNVERSELEADLAGFERVHVHEQDAQGNRKPSDGIEDLVEGSPLSMPTNEISEAVEAHRLEQYITDLSIVNKDMRSKLEAYQPASIRKIFYQRVFDTLVPEIPQREVAMRLVKYKGQVVRYGELYLFLLGEINRLVAYMTSPVEKGTKKDASRSNLRREDHFQPPRLAGDEAPRKNVYKASGSTKSCDSNREPIIRLQYPPFNRREKTGKVGESSEQSSDHGSDRLESPESSFSNQSPHRGAIRAYTSSIQHVQNAMSRPPNDMANLAGKQNSKFAFQHSSGLINPLLSKKKEGDTAATSDSGLGLQTRLGDPETAEFNPSAGSPYSLAYQNNSFLNHEDLRQDATCIPPGLPNTHQGLHEGSSNSYLRYPEIQQANHLSNTTIGPENHAVQTSIITAGATTGKDGRVPGIRRQISPLPSEFNSAMQNQLIADRLGSSGHDRQELLVSSQNPDVERYVHETTFLGSYVQDPPRDHSQHQARLLHQDQMHAETPENSLNRHHPDCLPQNQSLQGLTRQFHSQAIPLSRPGRYSTIPPGPPARFAAPAFLTTSPQNFGMQGSLVQAPQQQNQPWATINPYEQKMHQPLPHLQNPRSEAYERPGGGIPITFPVGQPYASGLNLELPPSSYQTAMPVAASSAYVQPYIPADKYARAPAPNRLASRFAQIHTFQPVQSTGSFNKSTMQHNRFSTPTISPRASLATLPYNSGSNDMFPSQRPGVASVRYQDLTRNEPPRFEIAGDENYMPFVETTKLSKPAEWGVLKISNMPYDITSKLIHSFLGTHAKTITSDLGPYIHIMMDRSTGKTQDCYIEFFSAPDANAWRSVIVRRGPHLNKIGDRILEVEVSCQEQLMKELFPRARCVSWNGPDGVQIKETEEAFDSGFKGFITQEELKGLIHHAEQPHRDKCLLPNGEQFYCHLLLLKASLTCYVFPEQSVYTQKCPPRPYANMISILAKFPWYATAHYTLSTRNALFNATLTLVKTLVSFLRRSTSLSSQGHRTNHSQDSNSSATIPSSNLPSTTSTTNMFRPDLRESELSKLDMRQKGMNEGLLKELVLAGLNAYGFSDSQRYQLYLSASPILGRDWIRLSPLMSKWPFEVVGRKAGFEEDVVEFYAYLLSSHPNLTSTSTSTAPSLATNRHPAHPHAREQLDPNLLFGSFSTNLYEQNVEGYTQRSVSMQALGRWEMDIIMGVIKAMCCE